MPKLVPLPKSFIKPRFFESLGEEGLTAKDIADSLGVELRAVHQKVKRQWKNESDTDFRVITNVISNDSNKVAVESYIFTTLAAKAFVARWRSDIGDAYLKFLLACEKSVLNEFPKLLRRIAELEQSERIRLESESAKRLRSESRRGLITTYVTNTLFSVFDEAMSFVPKTISIPRAALTESEIATNERIHCSHRLNGVTQELNKREQYELAILSWERLSPEQRTAIPRPERYFFGLK